MTHKEIIDYCLKKPGAYLDYPFDPVIPVVKVKAPSQEKGRIFALSCGAGTARRSNSRISIRSILTVLCRMMKSCG